MGGGGGGGGGGEGKEGEAGKWEQKRTIDTKKRRRRDWCAPLTLV